MGDLCPDLSRKPRLESRLGFRDFKAVQAICAILDLLNVNLRMTRNLLSRGRDWTGSGLEILARTALSWGGCAVGPRRGEVEGRQRPSTLNAPQLQV